VPAPGQGIVAIETRVGDDDVRRTVSAIDEPLAAAALMAERSLVEALGGGCQTPIGALATGDGAALELMAAVLAIDGSRAIHETARAPMSGARALGIQVAERLLARGAKEILEEASHTNSHQSPVTSLQSAKLTDD
jgi:hydroxymethylbilane synthase